MPLILGVDPGIQGALAFLDTEAAALVVVNIPIFKRTGSTKTKSFVDAVAMADHIRAHQPAHVFVEQVASSTQMGVVSAFSFGQTFGTIKGVLAALLIPLDEVLPQVWKREMRVPKDKAEAVARARDLMPACSAAFGRPDRAEAALIALYGALKLGFMPTKPVTLREA